MNYITKIELIKKIKEYIIKNSPIMIKFIQIFLLTNYRWNKNLSNEEIDEINNILNNCQIEYIDSDFYVGSGSVAFVKFKNEEKKIVVKELIPNIKDQIKESYEKVKSLFKIKKYINLDIVNIDSIDKYKDILVKQTNLRIEGRNLTKLKYIFENNNRVIIPELYEIHKQKIEMEYLNGNTISNFIKSNPTRKNETILLLFSSIYHMSQNNFIHGDLHEGNFLFELIDNKVIIKYLDFGICHIIDNDLKKIIHNYLFNHNINNRCKFYYEMTDKSLPFKKFVQFYKDNMEEYEKGMNIPLFIKNGYRVNVDKINLVLSLVHLRVKYFNLDLFDKYFKLFYENNFLKID